MYGYAGKIGFVDLSTGEIREGKLDESLARSFIGGHGLGARFLFENQKAMIDPLGPENILGFTTGPLTGTKTAAGSRYMVVSKSPLTNGWGDSNAGGYFGSELKSAGWDAIFFSGIAPTPKYLLITNEGLKLRDASQIWGKDTVDTENILKNELGIHVKIASIGPSSERLSLISGIVNDKGRIAARSGLGAVMGSKHLKALAVCGTQKVLMADKNRLNQLRKTFLRNFHEIKGPASILMKHGTCGLTDILVHVGATPIKNWMGAGPQAFPTFDRISDGDNIIAYQVKKFACANCPIACGGIVSISEGSYPVTDSHKPEYETIAAFGTMCLNDDLFSIFKLNDMCNRSGLDTISTGTVLAFAMECFERGVITKEDTDGIELTWGNSQAMILLLEKIIRREGLGDILADGVRAAAKKMGKGAEECALNIGGQEPGLHSPLFGPGRGTGYICDPTPGRHTTGVMARLDTGSAVFGPYPELQFSNFEQYEYKLKGPGSARISCYCQVAACAGICLLPVTYFENYPLLEFLNSVTGWDININEALETGARIQTLRQCFNVREGIRSSEIKLHPRMVGVPPQVEGPVAGITIDIDSLAFEYRKAMGWDPNSGYPTDASLERLGLKKLIDEYGK